MHRTHLQATAASKLADAQLLLANERFGNAYYLAGYAVEIGLKACIARQVVAEVFPDKRFVNEIYDHDFRKLVGAAGLSADLAIKKKADERFDSNWSLVCEWRPDKRYATMNANDARLIIAAIDTPCHGVFEWIRASW